MGVSCILKSATDEQLRLLQRDPRLVQAFFDGEAEPEPASFWQRLFRRSGAIPPAILEQADSMETDLDTAWHGLHFLFTGTAEAGDLPAAFLFKGGREVGQAGQRAISAAEAREIKEHVHSLSEEDLRARFDPDRMTELDIYPKEIWKRDPDESFGYLLANFEVLQAFSRDVVDENQGFVVWIE